MDVLLTRFAVENNLECIKGAWGGGVDYRLLDKKETSGRRDYILLKYDKEKGILKESPRKHMKAAIQNKHLASLEKFLTKNKADIFLKRGNKLIPTGSKTKHLYELLMSIPEEIRLLDKESSWDRCNYRLTLDLKGVRIIATSREKTLYIKTKEDVENYILKASYDLNMIKEKERDFIDKLKELDPYLYYEPESHVLCIGGDHYSFNIKQNYPSFKKRQYGIRFKHIEERATGLGYGYKNTVNLDRDLKTLEDDVRKNWLKKAMSSYPFDMVLKMLVFAKQRGIPKINEKGYIQTELSLDRINEDLKATFPHWNKYPTNQKKTWIVEDYLIKETKDGFEIKKKNEL